MSSGIVDLIHVRLKAELSRLSLKAVDAARQIGLEDSQPIRDVVGGRKRLSADLLGLLVPLGVDAAYVLTGERDGPPPEVLAADERELLALFRSSSLAGKAAAIGALQGVAGAAPKGKYTGAQVGGVVEGDFNGTAKIKQVQKIKKNTGQLTQGGKIINKGGGTKK